VENCENVQTPALMVFLLDLSEKRGKISDKIDVMIASQPIEEMILSRFYGHGRGHVATQKDFLELGSRAAVDKALSRLAQQGKLRRIGRGLYEYPKVSKRLGVLSPDLQKVIRAVAGKEAIRLQPTGAFAANQLHLSEQVPMRVVYLTDGRSRRIVVGSQTIELKKSSLKRMQLADRISGLVFEALRHLGKETIGDREVGVLRKHLSSDQKRQIKRDLPLAPTWMHEIILAISNQDTTVDHG
jgi:hypothetical protein